MPRNLAAYCLVMVLGSAAAGHCVHTGDLACLTCHSAPSFQGARGDGKRMSLHVDYRTLASSVHSDRSCVDCHVDFQAQKFPHKRKADPVECARCHHKGNRVGAPNSTHIELYADSVHGSALKTGDPDAPGCKACHGAHDVRPSNDPRSTTFRSNISETCGRCHFDAGFAQRHGLASVERYKDSIHARAVERKAGIRIAAVCTDCHGVHDIRGPGQSGSSAGRPRRSHTCGKCHKDVLEEYEQSIHGRAVARGVRNAPVCNDCHGEHLISKPSSPDSPVYPTHVAQTCSKCHEDVGIQRRFGLPANRLSSYIGSYHGVANKYGDVTVANCATCHGPHNVLPSSDPRSAVNKKNLPRTCSKCHPGAGKNFAAGSIHVIPTPKQDAVVFWVRAFYLLFVVGLIGSFTGYILLDMCARLTGRLPWKRGSERT